ncbi:MAG: L,D-transpeptidase family protein [Hyphomicrobiales bacterium]|nr:L,D-transpeptidase family protein [Hyphomicrobiales bacterium]
MHFTKIAAVLIFTSFVGTTASQGANVSGLLEKQAVKWRSSTISPGPLRKFYKSRHGRGIWTDDEGLNDRGKKIVELIAKAREDGLIPSDYIKKFPKKLKTDELPSVELYLSQAFWRFGRDLYAGRTTPSVSAPDIVISRKKYDLSGWLVKAGRRGPGIVIDELRPPHQQYAELRKKLAKTKNRRKARKIIVNMERWRWLPRKMGRRHVLVNQASYEMFIRTNDKIVDRRRVVVGKPYHKTPMFSHAITYAEFNPTWTVSRSIAGEEFLPKLRRNSSYLEKRDYKIYASWDKDAEELDVKKVNWRKVSSKDFPYRIVQSPGKKNALGKVKFMFPNRFKIYLHDTPSKRLFKNSRRAYSHGCIRIQKPLEFATKLFKSRLSKSKIDKILERESTTIVKMRRSVPIHLTYFTLWIDEKGKMKSYKDVYKRDRMVGRILFGGA